MKKKLSENSPVFGVLASVMSIISGLAVGLIIMLIFNPETAFTAFGMLLKGGFSNGLKSMGQVFHYIAPYAMCGLSVAFSFQTGVFNIGVAGQFTVGGMVAVLIGGMALGIPDPIRWIVAIFLAGLAGVIWGMIPGLMKAFLNCNEVIACIMMNYISIYFSNWVIQTYFYDPTLVASKYVKSSSLLPRMGMDKLFPGSSASSAVFIALLFCIVIYILLYRTGFGYELRASGFNKDAAYYAGINEKRNIILVMLIAGFIAGVGGGMLFLSSQTKNFLVSEIAIVETSYGIPIALLALNNPIGVFCAAFLLSWLTVGGTMVQSAGFPTETVETITAVIIYFSAFSLIFTQLIQKWYFKKGERQKGEK